MENQKCKCAQYWPASVAKDMSFDEFTISLLTCSLSSEYNISTFKISNSKDKEGSERTINHFHYHAWPDFGIPDSPDSFLKFLCLVRQQNAVHSPPPVIHCSAGKSTLRIVLHDVTVLIVLKIEIRRRFIGDNYLK